MWYQPGDVVRIRVNGFIQHEGIMTDTGRVISNSRRLGCVSEESTRAFAGGRAIKHIGRLSNMLPEQVIANARARIGQPYSAFDYNCQHFVRECYGLGRRSPQKKLTMGVAALAVLIAIF